MKRRRNLRGSLQFRLLLIGSLPLLLITVLFTSYAIYSRQGDMLSKVESFGKRTADYLANTLDFTFFVLEPSMLVGIAADIQTVPGVDGVAFLDPQRRLLHATSGFPLRHDGFDLSRPLGAEPVTVGTTLLVEREVRPKAWEVEDYPMANPTLDSTGRPLGWVVVAVDLAETQQAQRTIMVSSIGIGASVLGTALLMSLVLSRLVVTPIRRLTQTVTRLRQGDLKARARPSASDELAELAEGINHLGESVERSQRELEQQVDQATGDLRTTLDTLRAKNRELELATETAESANRAKSDFLARMSHELRTPLTSIQGFVRLLENALPDAADRSYCHIIDQAATSLMALIDDILEFARLQTDPQHSLPVAFALRDPLEGAVRLLAPTAHEKGVDIYLDIDPQLPDTLIGDPRALRQIINNLVGNAVKFTASGHVLVQCGQPAAGCLGIWVRDTGIGIAPEQQQQIFEAFQQADSGIARRFGGTGLGLAITQHHVEILGGTITLCSHPGEGSEFFVSLPCRWQRDEGAAAKRLPGLALVYDTDELGRNCTLQTLEHFYTETLGVSNFDALIDLIASRPIAALNVNWSLREPPSGQLASLRHLIDELRCPIAVQIPLSQLHDTIPADMVRGHPHVHWLGKPASLEELQASLGAETPPKHVQTADLSGVRVLVVEDNVFSRMLLGALLERTGCEHIEAANGQAAVDLCGHQLFDVILMDLHMPEMAGVEALTLIQRPGEPNADTPVIVLTADQILDAGRELHLARVDRMLNKPYDERQLLEIMLELTGRCGRPPAGWFGSSSDLPRDLYFDEIDRLLAAIEQGLASRDLEAARGACHQLVGIVAVFKLGELEQQTRLLHSLVRVADWERAEAMVIRMRDENQAQRRHALAVSTGKH